MNSVGGMSCIGVKKAPQNSANTQDLREQKIKWHSVKLLLLLSFVPLIVGGLLSFLEYFNLPSDPLARLMPALMYRLLSIIVLPIYIIITVGGYLFLEKRRNLIKLSRFYLTIPIVTSIIGVNMYYIFAVLTQLFFTWVYESKYKGLNPKVEIISQEIIRNPYTQVNWNPVTYKFQLRITNDTEKTFQHVPFVAGFYEEGCCSVISPPLTPFKPGVTIVDGVDDLSDFELICKDFLDYSKLYYKFGAAKEYQEPNMIDIGTEVQQELELVKQEILQTSAVQYLVDDCPQQVQSLVKEGQEYY